MFNGIGLGSQGNQPQEQGNKPAPTAAEAVAENKAPEAAPTTETKAPETKAEPEKKPLSSSFAALARKEKEARQRAEQFKTREAQLAEREAKLKELEETYSSGKKNPIEALKRLGWTYEEITNHILNDQKPTPEREIQSVREEMEQWRKQQQEEKERERLEKEEAKKSEYNKAIEDFKHEMNDFIKSNEETYELINLHDQQELVYATIEEHYQTTLKEGNPKVLSNKEACDLVEQYLEGQLERMTQTKKFKSKYEKASSTEKETDPSKSQPTKTLSNAMVSSSAPSTLSAKTEQERLQRALAALSK